MRLLSKSKIMAFRQCPRRLWLEVHHPELRNDSASTQRAFSIGSTVGEVARRLYDPAGTGTTIDVAQEGVDGALASTVRLLGSAHPIFEGGFSSKGALAFADALLPVVGSRWRMVEVKSSTGVRTYQREDVAVQAYIAKAAGLPLDGVAVAHVDGTWVYPGAGDYRGLLVEEDLTTEAFERAAEVEAWIDEASRVADLSDEPVRPTGDHCSSPFDCGFHSHCVAQEPPVAHPVQWLPTRRKALKEYLANEHVMSMDSVPDELLNELQLRVKMHTLSGTAYFDLESAKQALSPYSWPAYYLDFETVQFAVPIWEGTRPYQQIPFQFSVHFASGDGALDHQGFLDVSGNDPRRAVAEALIRACGETGPIFCYYASFEATRIRELAEEFMDLRDRLMALIPRIVDLLPIAQDFFYHPSQEGSWSLKKVLPAVFPDVPQLDYRALGGIADGGAASQGYLEAISPRTPWVRKVEIEKELSRYCELDTYALVHLHAKFRGEVVPGRA